MALQASFELLEPSINIYQNKTNQIMKVMKVNCILKMCTGHKIDLWRIYTCKYAFLIIFQLLVTCFLNSQCSNYSGTWSKDIRKFLDSNVFQSRQKFSTYINVLFTVWKLQKYVHTYICIHLLNENFVKATYLLKKLL